MARADWWCIGRSTLPWSSDLLCLISFGIFSFSLLFSGRVICRCFLLFFLGYCFLYSFHYILWAVRLVFQNFWALKGLGKPELDFEIWFGSSMIICLFITSGSFFYVSVTFSLSSRHLLNRFMLLFCTVFLCQQRKFSYLLIFAADFNEIREFSERVFFFLKKKKSLFLSFSPLSLPLFYLKNI